jgi:hypothetical protein
MLMAVNTTLKVLFSKFLAILISIVILARSFPRIIRNQHVFINFRAFGHSISDTNAFLSTYAVNGLCISIGNNLERNPFLSCFYPKQNLIQVTLPKLRITGRINLRKIVGPQLLHILLFLQRVGTIPKSVRFYSENKLVVSECVYLYAVNTLQIPDKIVQKTIDHIQFTDVSAREHSKAVGTWAQIYNPKIIGEGNKVHDIDEEFLREIEAKGVDRENLVTLILRLGASPHHGPGLAHYQPVIRYLQEKGYTIIPLGDTDALEMSKDFNRKQLVFPHDLRVPRRSVDFSSILYSKFTLGDMSGLWTIFTLRGKRGLCLNTTPTKLLINRAEVLPRRWKDSNGVTMELSQQFGLFGETVRGKKREEVIDGFKPSFHDPLTMLNCVRRFESEVVAGTPLIVREPFLKYFEEYPRGMLEDCSIAPEVLLESD